MDASSLRDFEILHFDPNYFDPNGKEVPTLPEDPIALKQSSSWTYCGPLLSLNAAQLPFSFESWAQATIHGSLSAPLLAFLEFVHEFLIFNDLSHYWLTIRASKGSHEFDVPRWHTDDLFFSPTTPTLPTHRRRSSLPRFPNAITRARRATNSRQRRQSEELYLIEEMKKESLPSPAQVTTTSPNPANWKLTTTLLGPGTLFVTQKSSSQAREIQRNIRRLVVAENPDHNCLSVRCVGCTVAAESVRTRLAAELENHDIVQAQQGECVFFRVGENDGAVHSEPMSHGDRIFVNIVPGHEEDLRSLMAKWGMEYPRAWCVGLPCQVAEEACWKNFSGI